MEEHKLHNLTALHTWYHMEKNPAQMNPRNTPNYGDFFTVVQIVQFVQKKEG